MSDEAALLHAIYANHDDDTPRLVYADWLDEHDQPERAEFIRVQIAVARRTDHGEESQRLYCRERELLDRHREKWLREFEPFDSEKVEIDFARGFPEILRLTNATARELNILRKLLALSDLSWDGGTMTPAILREIAGLKHLESLQVFDTTFRPSWLEFLEPLPHGAVIRIQPRDRYIPNDVWNAFHERRMKKFAKLNLDEQRKAALRYLWYFERDATGLRSPVVKRARLNQSRVCNAELGLVVAVPELEEIYSSNSDITSAGLEHLAQLPNLKSLELFSVQVESLAPLARCTGLEKFQIYPDVVITDERTEGLERLTNLRELILRNDYGEGYGDRTVQRLGSLRKLRSLELDVGEIANESCFAALSHLVTLETLVLYSLPSDGVLRYLAQLRRLKRSVLMINDGNGDGFRHIAGLSELRSLHLHGDGVTDAGILHLAPLKNLQTLNVCSSRVTKAGATVLANQLLAATIILDKHVIKSPRKTITFRREVAGEFASVLFPVHWVATRSVMEANEVLRQEDGWDGVSDVSAAVCPADLFLKVCAGDSKTVLGESMHSYDSKPRIVERDVVKLPGKDTASCVYQRSAGKHLVAAVAIGGRCAILDCEAPSARFEEFRPLFEYVARSLRVGKTAMKNVSKEKTVAVSRL
jgi:uncharacterized protein (TIGR02996 family)